MEHPRLIFHIDVNSAFLSWESVYRLEQDPQAQDLRTIPSAVGGDAKTVTAFFWPSPRRPKDTKLPPENLLSVPTANVRILS